MTQEHFTMYAIKVYHLSCLNVFSIIRFMFTFNKKVEAQSKMVKDKHL